MTTPLPRGLIFNNPALSGLSSFPCFYPLVWFSVLRGRIELRPQLHRTSVACQYVFHTLVMASFITDGHGQEACLQSCFRSIKRLIIIAKPKLQANPCVWRLSTPVILRTNNQQPFFFGTCLIQLFLVLSSWIMRAPVTYSTRLVLFIVTSVLI